MPRLPPIQDVLEASTEQACFVLQSKCVTVGSIKQLADAKIWTDKWM